MFTCPSLLFFQSQVDPSFKRLALSVILLVKLRPEAHPHSNEKTSLSHFIYWCCFKFLTMYHKNRTFDVKFWTLLIRFSASNAIKYLHKFAVDTVSIPARGTVTASNSSMHSTLPERRSIMLWMVYPCRSSLFTSHDFQYSNRN